MEIGLIYHKPRHPCSHGKAEEAKNRFSPRASRGSTVWLTPSVQLSGTDVGFLAFRALREREKKSVVLSLQMCTVCYSGNTKLKQTIYNCCNKFLKTEMCLWNWILKSGQENLGKHDSKCLDFLEQTVGRHLDTLGDSGESSEGSEEHGREICTFRDCIHVVTSTTSSEI